MNTAVGSVQQQQTGARNNPWKRGSRREGSRSLMVQRRQRGLAARWSCGVDRHHIAVRWGKVAAPHLHCRGKGPPPEAESTSSTPGSQGTAGSSAPQLCITQTLGCLSLCPTEHLSTELCAWDRPVGVCWGPGDFVPLLFLPFSLPSVCLSVRSSVCFSAGVSLRESLILVPRLRSAVCTARKGRIKSRAAL